MLTAGTKRTLIFIFSLNDRFNFFTTRYYSSCWNNLTLLWHIRLLFFVSWLKLYVLSSAQVYKAECWNNYWRLMEAVMA